MSGVIKLNFHHFINFTGFQNNKYTVYISNTTSYECESKETSGDLG